MTTQQSILVGASLFSESYHVGGSYWKWVCGVERSGSGVCVLAINDVTVYQHEQTTTAITATNCGGSQRPTDGVSERSLRVMGDIGDRLQIFIVDVTFSQVIHLSNGVVRPISACRSYAPSATAVRSS